MFSLFTKRYLPILMASGLLVAACSPGGGDAFQEAGPLVLLSVEPVVEEAPSSKNLIPNPDYVQQYPGAPAPLGWIAPSKQENSSVARLPVEDKEGSFLVRQEWERAAARRGLADHFKTEIIHLKPHTVYKLKLTTINGSRTGAAVSVGQMDRGGSFSFLAEGLIDIEPAPAERRIHEAQFTTGENGDVFIATHRSNLTTYSAENNVAVIMWLDWKLTEVGPA